jgi:two-component system, LytTR family, sensor kinase
MDSETEAEHAPPLRPHIVLLSIVIFWAFYFALVTIRSVVVFGGEDQGAMLVSRTIVTAVSMAATWLFYLLLRELGAGSLRRGIIAGALLAIPAAVIYGATNWYAFAKLDEKHKTSHTKVVITEPSTPKIPEIPKIPATPTIDEDGVVEPPEPPEPPIPPSMTTIQVGTEHPDEIEKSPAKAIADNSVNGYFFFIAWAALYLALSYAGAVKVLERRAAGLRSAAQAAELRALRYQVNPHFLFNTLNSLSSLVMIGKRAEAEQMILNLSTFFRTSFSGDPTEDVPLSDELQLQRLYLDIEAVRFPKRMRVEIDLPEALNDACVPGLILQPLVENAVKYGVARSRRPVTIRLSAREDSGGLLVTVENDGGTAKAGPDEPAGTGVGLANVRDRLLARFGDKASCRWGPLPGGGFAVILAMPIVRNGC